MVDNDLSKEQGVWHLIGIAMKDPPEATSCQALGY